MEVKRSILHAVYLHYKEKITFLKSIFATFLIILGHFRLYVELDDRYCKKSLSVTEKEINDHIHQLIYISLRFYHSGFGCKKFIKNGHFQTKNENSMTITQHLFTGAIIPWKWLAMTLSYTYLKAKNGDRSNFHKALCQLKVVRR